MVQTAQIWYSDWVYIVKGNEKVKTQNLSIFDPRHDVIVEYRGEIGPKFISRGKNPGSRDHFQRNLVLLLFCVGIV